MSQWAVCSPAWRFLYHVIVNCKGPICGIRTIMTISNRGNDCYNVAALVIFTIHMLCSPGPSFNALIWRSTETSEIDEIMIISFPLFSGWRHHGFLIILCTQNSRLPLKLTDYNYKNRNWKEHIKPPSRKTANATTGWCKQLILEATECHTESLLPTVIKEVCITF